MDNLNIHSLERNMIRYQAEYVKLPFEDYQVAMRRRCLLEILQNYKPQRILEIGCGMYPTFQSYQDFEKFCVVEPGDMFMRHARELAGDDKRISLINFKFENVYQMFLEGYFDFIIASSVLHEVKDCTQFMKCIYAVCGEFTCVHINVPNAQSFHRILGHKMGLVDSTASLTPTQELMQQYHTFDRNSLVKLVCDTGFLVIRSGSVFMKPFSHEQMDRMMKAGIINEKTLDGLYELADAFPENGSEIYVNAFKRDN
jgi:ubiquinone/menaquinone biosynthesis C-methylase UbiE